jgi:cellulose synthase/poly-beta-1,6-N-acetylglucosamine synthase-like glycosyltransferase
LRQEPFKAKNKKVFVIIPLYKEQKIVVDTINYFLKVFDHNNSILVLVTTTKEHGKESTDSKIRRFLKNKFKGNTGRILLFKEENESSNMATQINFALKEIIRLNHGHLNDFYILYNADSRPSPKTLNEIAFESMNDNDLIFQQPCAFIKDIGMKNSFVDAASLYQTWFCLGHENRVLKKYQKFIGKSNYHRGALYNIFLRPLGYGVGHGSAMKLRTIKEEGYYPEELLTEDLTLGYFLSAHHRKIKVINSLEIADVPFTLKSSIKQKSVWFWNYIEYFSCFFDKRVANVSLSIRLGLLFRGLGRGSYWLFSSFFYAFPIITSIFLKDPFLMISGILGILLFQVLPAIYLVKKLPNVLYNNQLKKYGQQIGQISCIKVAVFIIIITLTDSVGPVIALINSLQFLSKGKRPEKYKTEN